MQAREHGCSPATACVLRRWPRDGAAADEGRGPGDGAGPGTPGLDAPGGAPRGALVPALLERANAAVDNPGDAAAIETFFGSVTLVATGGSLPRGRDDGSQAELRDGETWTIACGHARVAYLAVRGGLDIPAVLGGRGTLPVSGLGTRRAGAAPRRRARERQGQGSPRALPPEVDLSRAIRVIMGPDLDSLPAGSLDALLSTTFHVDPRSDRVGVRSTARASRARLTTPASRDPWCRGPSRCHPTACPSSWARSPNDRRLPRRGDRGAPGPGPAVALPVGSSVRFVTEP